MERHPDAITLREAALVLRRRSTKPKSLTLDVLCDVLNSAADDIDLEHTEAEPGPEETG